MTNIVLWLAVSIYVVVMISGLVWMWREADRRTKIRQERRDWIAARLIFEHKSGSRL